MRPTASSLWLAEICPASHVLPQVRETNSGQRAGSWLHKFLELAPQAGKEAALAALPEDHRQMCEDLDPADLPHGLREEPLAYDFAKREGWQLATTGRDYPDMPGIGCGTVDVLSVHDRSIWDYKNYYAGPAKDSLQLLALGLYAARTFDWLRVTVGHLRVDGDKLHPDVADLGPLDLVIAHERIAKIYERYEQTKEQELPDVFPGDHCTMCSAAPSCPATTAMTRQVSQALSEEQRIVEMVEADPAGAWSFYKRAADALERLKAELKRRAALAPIPLKNGKQLAIVEVDKSRIDGKIGLPLLRESIVEIDALCSVSKSAIEKKMGKRSAKVLLDRLDTAGAIDTHTEHHLREVRATERAA